MTLLMIGCIMIAYYLGLMAVFSYHSKKFEAEDKARGITRPILIGAQVETWHVLFLVAMVIPFVLFIIFAGAFM